MTSTPSITYAEYQKRIDKELNFDRDWEWASQCIEARFPVIASRYMDHVGKFEDQQLLDLLLMPKNTRLLRRFYRRCKFELINRVIDNHLLWRG